MSKPIHVGHFAQLIHDLSELCVCEEEQTDPRCIFCESRLLIEEQARTLRLAQGEIAHLRQRIANLHEAIHT